MPLPSLTNMASFNTGIFPNSVKRISFVIPGKPVTKQGTNSRLITSAVGTSKVVHYTPERTRDWAGYVKYIASQYFQDPLWRGPMRLELVVKLVRPAARKNDKYCIAKPDFDNTFKNLCDAMAGIIYADDKAFVDVRYRKEFADVNQLEVTLELLQP